MAMLNNQMVYNYPSLAPFGIEGNFLDKAIYKRQICSIDFIHTISAQNCGAFAHEGCCLKKRFASMNHCNRMSYPLELAFHPEIVALGQLKVTAIWGYMGLLGLP